MPRSCCPVYWMLSGGAGRNRLVPRPGPLGHASFWRASKIASPAVVTTTADNFNAGSLRWAIIQANGGDKQITFNIPNLGRSKPSP